MRKSTTIRLILSLLICAAVSFSMPVFVHRREFDKAFMDWRRNPSAASLAALEEQGRQNQRAKLIDQSIGAVVLFIFFNGAWFGLDAVGRRIRKAPSNSRIV